MNEDYRKPSLILDELSDLNNLILDKRKLIEKYPERFSLKASLQNLKNRQDSLLVELVYSRERYNTDTFDFVFDGDIVKSHCISLPFLGSFAYTLQEVVTNISIATLNFQKPKKAINKEIQNSSQLDLLTTMVGSFRIIIGSQETPNRETQIGESLSKQSLRLLNSLTSYQDDKEKLKEMNKKIGIKSMKKYQKLMEIIYENNATIKMYDKIVPDGFHTEKIDSFLARRIYNAINEVTEKPLENITYFGLLTGVNVRSRNFEFVIDESQERISGNFEKSLVGKVAKRLNTKATIQFELNIKYDDVLGEEKPKWSIMAFLD